VTTSPDGKYKLLDCERTAILGLPSGAVHLWLCYYMHESEGGESWLSQGTIMRVTGMSKPTVIKWQRYLLSHGWLVSTGESAAQKYTNATHGAHRVPVVRVDDPTSGGKESLPPKNFTQGSCSGSGCASAFESESSSKSDAVSHHCLTEDQNSNKQTKNPEPKPAPVQAASPVAQPPLAVQPSLTRNGSRPPLRPKLAPDGTPYPAGFNKWKNAERLTWLTEHTPADSPPPAEQNNLPDYENITPKDGWVPGEDDRCKKCSQIADTLTVSGLCIDCL
jgi:hypothetical protein